MDTLYSQIGLVVIGLIALFTLIKGDQPERLAMIAYLLGWLASLLIQADGQPFRNWQPMLLALDLAMLLVLIGLAWKFRRTWPIWAAALQLIVVTSHLAILVDGRSGMRAFYATVNLAGLGVLIAIGLGGLQAWRARRTASLE